MKQKEFEKLQIGDRVTNIAALNGVIVTHRLEDSRGHVTFLGILPVKIDRAAGWAKIKRKK